MHNINPNNWRKYLALGSQITFGVAGLALLGHWLDTYFEYDRPWLTLIFSVMGILVSIVHLVRST
jgi:F0F1-type ATP synthase assembly protein I